MHLCDKVSENYMAESKDHILPVYSVKGFPIIFYLPNVSPIDDSIRGYCRKLGFSVMPIKQIYSSLYQDIDGVPYDVYGVDFENIPVRGEMR